MTLEDEVEAIFDLGADIEAVQSGTGLPFTMRELGAHNEIGGDEKGEEGTDPDDHRAGDLIEDVEVIVGLAVLVLAKELKVRVLGGILGGDGSKGPPLSHALNDVINAELFFSNLPLLAGSN